MDQPKINLIYYKNMLDIAFVEFVDEFNDSFVKNGDVYQFSSSMSRNRFKTIIIKNLVKQLSKIVKEWDISHPNYYMVIGSCMPYDNMLLKCCKDYSTIPNKLKKILDSNLPIKYVLKETDIKIDAMMFNSVFIEIFDDFFSNKQKLSRILKKNMQNVVFIQHRNLDCYSMFKTLKWIYGKNNCINVWKDEICKKAYVPKMALVSINELIDKYVNNKTEMNKSSQFKQTIQEIKDFLKIRILH